MDQFTEKQNKIVASKAVVAKNFPSLWQGMISKWARQDINDRVWMLYSANYLFCTSGVRWVIDPLTLRQRVPTAPDVDVSPFAALDYVVLTHRHADHLDLRLLKRMLAFPARWIVPEFMLNLILPLNPTPEKLIIPQPLMPLHLGKLTLIPFDGLHWETDPEFPDGRRGVPAMGYLAEFNDKRWLLPGDVRRYDPDRLPALDSLDGIFAHVWLGRGCALKDKLPLLESFCKFIFTLSPRRVVLSHLDELGRNANEYWDISHATLVRDELRHINPLLDVQIALMGNELVI
jgi:hypothetical protein